VTEPVRIVGVMVAPAVDEVEIWIVEVNAGTEAEADAATLSAQEAERYAALDRDARAIAVTTRAALRQLLGRRLALAPDDVQIVEGDDAKPVLAGKELEFNVAHSNGVALIAVAQVAVGVDIERVETIAPGEFDDVVAFVLTPRELDELVRLPEHERLAAYYRVWTRKEAFVKATGEGIAGRPLPEVVVGVGASALIEVVGMAEEELADWTVVDVDVPAGYVASLVVRHREPRITVRPWARP
jgi:4'-phosphopantetheinyl transferase